jgi:V/A-type H+-transporting ATPase subunit C
MAGDTRYAYAVTRVRGMETRLLDRQWIERLLSETPAGVLKALGDTAHQEAFSSVSRPEEIEAGLTKALAETLAVIARISPEPPLINIFRMRWDFRNLTSLIKASVQKGGEGEIGLTQGIGTIDVETLRKAVEDRNFVMLPAVLGEAARAALDAYRDRSEIRVIDHVLGRAVWAHALATARAHGNDFLVQYLRTEIDLANVKAFVRIKESGKDVDDLTRAFIPGATLELSFFSGLLGEAMDAFARAIEFGKYSALAPLFREWSKDHGYLLELACDNVLLKEVDGAKRIAYGIEPLVAFILYRQIEIKLVRAAIVAKLDGLERSDVEARLRSAHV